MLFPASSWVALALASSFTVAVPTYPAWALPEVMQDTVAISTYFNALAVRVGGLRVEVGVTAPSVCDLSSASMPTAPTPLPSPGAGLTLKHVALGRGTQNYTCASSTAVPTAVGAAATLYNVSCMAADAPAVLNTLPGFALQYDPASSPLTPSMAPNVANLDVSGIHYFKNLTTPFFNLDITPLQLGEIPCAKKSSSPAPTTAIKGQGGSGNGAVAWLYLEARDDATGGVSEVYRVNTAGGNPPASCSGMPSEFQVQYAAEYWFYGS